MNRTRRTIGVGAFIMLAVLGTDWALERAFSNSHIQGGAAVSDPAKVGDTMTAPLTHEPSDESDKQSATTESDPEYDRSDLILSQG